jgi:hypothetical protein
MNCLSAAEHVNDTTGVDRACPFATRNETPKRRAEVASVAADRRFSLTGPIMGDGRKLRPSLVRG